MEVVSVVICQVVVENYELQVYMIVYFKFGVILKMFSGKIQYSVNKVAFLDDIFDFIVVSLMQVVECGEDEKKEFEDVFNFSKEVWL